LFNSALTCILFDNAMVKSSIFLYGAIIAIRPALSFAPLRSFWRAVDCRTPPTAVGSPFQGEKDHNWDGQLSGMWTLTSVCLAFI
jgi:hypothetical protein